MGHRGPKRNRTQRERDRTLVAHWSAAGFNQTEIVRKLSEVTALEAYRISQQQVSADLAAVRKEWREAGINDVNDLIHQQYVRLEWAFHEAVVGWESSKQPITETTVRRREPADGASASLSTATSEGRTVGQLETWVRKIDRLPDARFLEVMVAICERAARLLGLDGPTQLSAAATTAGRGSVSAPTIVRHEDAAVMLVGRMAGESSWAPKRNAAV